MTKQRCDELDVMKFWGILLVVLGHVTNFYADSPLVSPLDTSESFGYVSSFIYQFHMPMFIFVSGAVYAFQVETLKKKSNIWTLIKKKSQRLLVPYVIFGFFIMVPLMACCHFREGILDYAYHGMLLSKDARHLWYVLALFEIFVLFWCMAKVVDVIKFPQWILLPVSLGLYLLSSKFPYLFQISVAFKYQFWFTLGYEFMIYKRIIHDSISYYIVGGVFLVLVLLYKNNLSFKIPFIETIAAMCGIMLVYHVACDMSFLTRYKWYQWISKNSYGIYLYHVIVIYLMFYWSRNISISPCILVPLVFGISLIVSLILTEMTRKMGLQFLIGEKKK